MIVNVDEVFPDSLDGPRYERHLGATPSESEVTHNDSEDGTGSIPSSSPKLNHSQLSSSPGKFWFFWKTEISINLQGDQSQSSSNAFPFHKHEFSRSFSTPMKDEVDGQADQFQNGLKKEDLGKFSLQVAAVLNHL